MFHSYSFNILEVTEGDGIHTKSSLIRDRYLCISSLLTETKWFSHLKTYPTVVMVTSAHQNPSQTPFIND